MTFHIQTFGCKVNSFESAALAQMLLQAGYTVSEGYHNADIVVVNSCAVTSNSERKTHQFLRRVKQGNPGSIIVLTGCLPQVGGDSADLMDIADIVTGTTHRDRIIPLIVRYCQDQSKSMFVEPLEGLPFEMLNPAIRPGHTRAFLKIEDGCDRYCAYCIVPHARGNVRSMPLGELEAQAVSLAGNGYKEIVLTGINLSMYGTDIGLTLADALEHVAAIAGIERVRLSSLEPDWVDESILERLACCKKLCPHFHLVLQSGCDATLARMGRRYTCRQYLTVADGIRSAFDAPTFTTDMIVGFPGETDRDFEESMEFMQAMRYLKVHVFPYSPRPGTVAADMPDQIAARVRSQRAKTLLASANGVRLGVMGQYVGRTERMILEQRRDAVFTGYTDRYLPACVVADSGHAAGDVVCGVIQSVEDGVCRMISSG